MYKWSSNRIAVILSVLMVLALMAAPTFAQDDTPDQQEMAAQQTCLTQMTQTDIANQTGGFTGRGNWQMLCGQAAVFAFDGGGADEQIQVEMAVDPAGSANFSVYTTQQWANIGQGGEGTAMGSGTVNEQLNGNLFWQGSTPERGTFYVLVQPTSQGTSRFWITTAGTGAGPLRFQPPGGGQVEAQQEATATPTAAQAQQGAATPAATPQAQPGAAPGTLPVTGGTVAGLLLAGAAMFAAGWWTRRRTG